MGFCANINLENTFSLFDGLRTSFNVSRLTNTSMVKIFYKILTYLVKVKLHLSAFLLKIHVGIAFPAIRPSVLMLSTKIFIKTKTMPKHYDIHKYDT